MRLRSFGLLALALTLALAPRQVEAQVRQAALARITLLNKKAMDEYDGLEFEAAKKILVEAIGVAESASIRDGKELVQTYMNLGIVYGAGLNDRLNAVKYFTEAIRADATVTLDAARSTPILEEMFKSAKESVGTTRPPKRAGGFRHTPLDEAPEGKSLRIRARVGQDVSAAKVVLYYRVGSEFESVVMSEDRPGLYMGTIPGDRVTGKSVHYYLEAQDEGGQRVDGHGTAANPNIIVVRPREGGTGPGPGPTPRRSRKVVSINVMVGTGLGVVYGGQSEHEQPQVTGTDAFVDIKPGGALAPFHVAPELSYHLSDNWHLSGLVRIQIVNATTFKGKVSVLGMVRAKRFFGSGSLRHFLAFGGGGGEVRHRIALGDYDGLPDTPNDIVDARVAGVGAFGLAYGLRYMFTPAVGFVAELSGTILVPQFAANLDLNTGLVFSF
ncbi:MAG: tetratricopeptide repeat protein [Acidobacteriota bacterium]